MASPFSFHCIICFEEFDPVERFPVVFPCGHTYVCHDCGMRLDRCMECRTSLYREVAVECTPAVVPPSFSSRRTRRVRDPIAQNMRNMDAQGQQQNTPSKKKTNERVPLPKNVVLLSLMEATEYTSESAEHASQAAVSKSASYDENDEDEEDRIRQNLTVCTSSCGTYAVATKKGLTIYATRPKSSNPASPSNVDMDSSAHGSLVLLNIDRDVQRIVNSTPTRKKKGKRLEDTIDENGNISPDHNKEESPSMILHYGDRVQVVSMSSGWAKLARGYGFVYCEQGSELVKVGNSVDKTCRVEAMLHGLSLRRNKIRREQDKIENEVVGLMNAFQNSLIKDDDITVIDSSSFQNDSPLTSRKKKSSSSKTSASTTSKVAPEKKPITSTPTSTPKTAAVEGSPVSRTYSASPTNLFASSGYNNENEENLSPRSNISRSSSSTSNSPIINPNMVEGAREWRRKNLKHAARGIDFRTGMSGHHAVHSGGSHPHEFLGRQSHSNRGLLKMSSHTGLTVINRSKRRVTLDFPSLNKNYSN